MEDQGGLCQSGHAPRARQGSGSSHSNQIPGHGTGFGEHGAEAKLAELRATLKSWRGMKSCRK